MVSKNEKTTDNSKESKLVQPKSIEELRNSFESTLWDSGCKSEYVEQQLKEFDNLFNISPKTKIKYTFEYGINFQYKKYVILTLKEIESGRYNFREDNYSRIIKRELLK